MKHLKKRVVLITVFIGMVFISKAQDPIVFKIKYLPDHKYVSSIKTISDISMNIEGDKAMIDKIKASGATLPIKVNGEKDMTVLITTGPLDNNTFPLLMKYTSSSNKQTIAGKSIPVKESPLLGQSIYGHSEIDGKISVDSISGTKLSDTIKNAMAKIIEGFTQQVKFPERALKVGDSFSQEVPFSMPVSGMNMAMVVKIDYLYTGQNNNIAHFDLRQTVSYDLSQTRKNIILTGTAKGMGTGKLDYLINENIAQYFTSNLTLNMSFKIKEMTMSGLAKISSSTNIVVSKL